MSIMGLESGLGAAATATDGSKSGVDQKKLADNFDTFLVMLTTQLKHQDPLSPMDSTEFTNQLVQFANVEQQIAANGNLEKLIGMNQLNLKSWSINYIGNYIEAASSMLPLQGSVETQTDEINHKGGTSYFSYDLAKDANTVKVMIKDEAGNVVKTMSGGAKAGRHEMEWDGKNADGDLVANGKYSLEVVAVNSEGAAVEATPYVMTQAGKASFSYTLAEDARTVAVVIKDASGSIIRSLTGRGEAGRHEMEWDGRDKDGRLMKDGAYKIEVVATDAEQEPVEAVTTVYGRVTDVSADDNETLLNMSGVVTTVDNVLTVREKTAVQSVN